MNFLTKIVFVTSVVHTQSLDGQLCTIDAGCVSKGSICCEWHRAPDAVGLAENGSYCADSIYYELELGPIGSQSRMLRG